MIDLYTYAASNMIGLTSCAPINKTDVTESSKFHGALCINVDASGPLCEYFPFSNGTTSACDKGSVESTVADVH